MADEVNIIVMGTTKGDKRKHTHLGGMEQVLPQRDEQIDCIAHGEL